MQFVWVAKFHSGVRRSPRWLVLDHHPGHAKAEFELVEAKKTLRLKRRGKTSDWRIWPYPFIPPDARTCVAYPGQRLIQEGAEP
jgi:hypothetical protein